MKITLRKMVPAALLACLVSSSALAQSRVATVDFERVLTNYWKTKQARDAIGDRINDLGKEGKNLLDDLDKAKKEYQKLLDAAYDPAVSTDEHDRRKKAADAKDREKKDIEDTIGKFNRQAEATITELRRRMRDRIYSEIRDAINAKAKAAGYALVIDSSAKSGNNIIDLVTLALNRIDPTEEAAKSLPVVLYASGDNDLTEELLKQLNAGAPLETPKPEEKKDEKKK